MPESEKKLYRKYLGKDVSIGIRHLYDPNKLFFHKGTCVSVSEETESLILQQYNGLKRIFFSEILSIEQEEKQI